MDDIRAAAGEADTAIEAVRGYFYRMIERRDQLILPLRGGPVVASAEAAALREEVGRELGDMPGGRPMSTWPACRPATAGK